MRCVFLFWTLNHVHTQFSKMSWAFSILPLNWMRDGVDGWRLCSTVVFCTLSAPCWTCGGRDSDSCHYLSVHICMFCKNPAEIKIKLLSATPDSVVSSVLDRRSDGFFGNIDRILFSLWHNKIKDDLLMTLMLVKRHFFSCKYLEANVNTKMSCL